MVGTLSNSVEHLQLFHVDAHFDATAQHGTALRGIEIVYRLTVSRRLSQCGGPGLQRVVEVALRVAGGILISMVACSGRNSYFLSPTCFLCGFLWAWRRVHGDLSFYQLHLFDLKLLR